MMVVQWERRQALLGGAALALSGLIMPCAALAGGPGADSAQAAVTAALAGRLDPAKRLALLADDALVISDDVPFIMDKPTYADHLAFLSSSWSSCELALLEPRSNLHRDTAVVSFLFNLRGRPNDAGFRLRSGVVTAVCVEDGGTWRALGLHFGALSGQITDASPS
ncbi:DUF4440 domain-containing protein [Novosphingobium sp. Gsoil 351]|uniref:DUF4440 domain-containing protein n=1 Tax=Novosphingobium sp. Gsoil 351 TaxID=2675225 RepID=UPI0012B4B149|nr:DUF4440 domain-containing protein [Novosphingobium sp. Gsoil 351]QGN53965.1 hypothetical protein GKE62_04835 [Novosphingobium sp. Gsoil 351]